MYFCPYKVWDLFWDFKNSITFSYSRVTKSSNEPEAWDPVTDL